MYFKIYALWWSYCLGLIISMFTNWRLDITTVLIDMGILTFVFGLVVGNLPFMSPLCERAICRRVWRVFISRYDTTDGYRFAFELGWRFTGHSSVLIQPRNIRKNTIRVRLKITWRKNRWQWESTLVGWDHFRDNVRPGNGCGPPQAFRTPCTPGWAYCVSLIEKWMAAIENYEPNHTVSHRSLTVIWLWCCPQFTGSVLLYLSLLLQWYQFVFF